MNVRSSALMTLLTCCSLLLGALPCGAADRIFVSMTSSKHGDIKGEVPSTYGSMEAVRFADEFTRPIDTTGSAGAATGKVQRAPVVFTKHADKASPIILEAFAMGETFPSVVFNFVKESGNGDHAYHTIKLSNARITRLARTASPDGTQGAPLLETISLFFDRIEETSRPVSAQGNVSTVVGTFNFVTNTK